ncbi:hypothetical protein BD31_I0879 [Candidatus Nitrosopumilus salaria BD31]|uniref:SIS domain-containing protein n=1 Tax=Candidatus Nitrosopumilus salarius BD31 TaxID=859350 RepID=I3CZP8_9ARCH|nr:hypothetical protein [Candidatus Nitrosopumilus salaria]EIJ64941.1 hypothetical protein BD31_I0879 [Candidatus Nitrosopumilus salaria BD31]
MDPLDLYKNKKLVKSKHIYFISVSGNTFSNVKVAKIAKKSTAVTSDSASRLANESNQIIQLHFPSAGVFTAGSISFLASALTCISLVKKIIVPNEVIFQKAKSDAKKVELSERIFILGNMFTYPIAMYCAAKFYEVLGYDAHYCRIEQFSHMELFSAKKGDSVIIFEEKNSHNKQLDKHLKKIGMNVIHPDIPSKKLDQIIFSVFFSQMIVLNEAKKKKMKECHFVDAKNIRNVSNQMIY